MKKIFQILVMVAVFCTVTFAFAAEISNGGYVEGEAVLYPNGQDLNARNRLIELMAYRNLAEQVGELYISSSSTVKDAMLLDDTIKAKVETSIQGAKIVSKIKHEDGTFEAKVRLSIYGGRNSLANAVLPEQTQVEDLPKPKFTNLASGMTGENYTGLIIDCRGKNLSTAIIPSIKSADGTEIYAYKNVTRQLATERGMVSYVDTIEEANERVGSKPLTIKAVYVSGDCDAVVNDEDASRILIANQSSKFLNNCNVVFVR